MEKLVSDKTKVTLCKYLGVMKFAKADKHFKI